MQGKKYKLPKSATKFWTKCGRLEYWYGQGNINTIGGKCARESFE